MLHQHIIHFIRDWKETGAVMPSSRYLARDAVRRVVRQLEKPGREPVSVLELGPGTGTFTERILPKIKKGDRFDVVELNSYFYKILKRRFSTSDSIQLHHQDFLTFRPEHKYDFVISSIPYESIPAKHIRLMWEHKLSLCKPDTYIIYYKYVNFNQFRSRYEKQLVRNYCLNKKLVFLNMPPARLITLKIDDPEKSSFIIRNNAGVNGTFNSIIK